MRYKFEAIHNKDDPNMGDSVVRTLKAGVLMQCSRFFDIGGTGRPSGAQNGRVVCKMAEWSAKRPCRFVRGVPVRAPLKEWCAKRPRRFERSGVQNGRAVL